MFQTWNMKLLDSWQQSFHPGCQSCILLVYLNSLWDVGIRNDITCRETLFEPWRKNFGLFVKTLLYVSKGTLWVKKQLLKVLIFFQSLQVFEWTFTVLGEKIFGRDIKIESYSLRLERSLKKPNFWKFSFFSNSSELWTNIYRAWRKTFRQGFQNWKLQSSSQKINQRTKLLKVLFFFQFLQKFERTFTVLGEKFFGGDIKIGNCSLRLIRSNKKWNFWKITFFSKSSELWTNIYRAWRKSFGQVYQNWKLYSMSSEYQFGDKINFLNVL